MFINIIGKRAFDLSINKEDILSFTLFTLNIYHTGEKLDFKNPEILFQIFPFFLEYIFKKYLIIGEMCAGWKSFSIFQFHLHVIMLES